MIYEVESPLRQEVKHEKARKERTKDRKNSIPGNGAKKCCRTDCHDNAQTRYCHPDPRSLLLSLSPAAKGVDPMGQWMTNCGPVGLGDIRGNKHLIDFIINRPVPYEIND